LLLFIAKEPRMLMNKIIQQINISTTSTISTEDKSNSIKSKLVEVPLEGGDSTSSTITPLK
jgi:hypothetical protein